MSSHLTTMCCALALHNGGVLGVAVSTRVDNLDNIPYNTVIKLIKTICDAQLRLYDNPLVWPIIAFISSCGAVLVE